MSEKSPVMSKQHTHTLQSLHDFGEATLRGMYITLQVERDRLREALQEIAKEAEACIDNGELVSNATIDRCYSLLAKYK